MNATLEVVRAGLLSTIQDKGRFGLRHLGIPWAGALCPAWHIVANALVGNAAEAPVIECFEGGLQLQACCQSIRLAIVGCESAILKTGNDAAWKRYPPNRTLTLAAGESVHLSSTGSSRHIVIAVSGINIRTHLGSSSTYAKASLGGLYGESLTSGDQIPISQADSAAKAKRADLQCHLPTELRYLSTQLRAIAGPQFDHFSSAGVNAFLESNYEISSEADRMGVRLNGPVIEHRDSKSKDIVSDAIVPGSIQIPGTGKPIVMLNDAHTAGGYPKIATVISSDLPLLGIQRAGSPCQFKLIDINEAIAIKGQIHTLIDQCIGTFTPCIVNELDTQTLLSFNLIDGVTDGA